MSVFTREALEGSPLADLHAIATELSIDGFRRLRKQELADLIIERQGGEPAPDRSEPDAADAPDSGDEPAGAGDDDAPARPRRSRGGRSRGGRGRDGAASSQTADDGPEADADEQPRPARERRSRGGEGGGQGRSRAPREERSDEQDDGPEREVQGVVEVLANGSAFVRVGGAGTSSDDDVYVSAAQVRRCELVSGDTVAGPVRKPRRSERYASMVRVETINGGSSEEVSAGTPFDELPAVFPSEPLTFKAKDATLKQIADLAPIGRGSRVSVIGPRGAGRSTTLRLLAIELAAEEGVELSVVLAGARPEELGEWVAADVAAAASAPLGTSPDAQANAVERAIDAGRRVAARGGHAAVVIDSLDLLPAPAARRAMAAARKLEAGGSLTVIAAAREALGGETTVITLDGPASYAERRPVLDPSGSATLRLELLVGARKATTTIKNRAKALEASLNRPA